MISVKILAAVVFVVAALSCGSHETSATAVSIDSTSKLSSEKLIDTVSTTAATINTDSLQTHTIGEMVLNGTLKPSDNTFTFRLMDSLMAVDQESRKFYFTVFNKILDYADGALGEAIGDYALTYVEQHPGEFIANMKDLPQERLAAWASNIGIEISLSANDAKDSYKKFSESFINNCKGCSKQTIQQLQQFNKLVWQTVKENLNAEREQPEQ
jgi:hypothetical protein